MTSGEVDILSLREERAAEVMEALAEHDFVESSVPNRKPEPIVTGHPIHEAVRALEQTYPGTRLPPEARPMWKDVLNLSRKRDAAAFTAADRFIAWLDGVSSDAGGKPKGEKHNGPYRPYGFWWNGKPHHFSKRLWRLLDFMWTKEFAEIEDAIEEVWDGKKVSDSAVKSACSRLNTQLSNIGVKKGLEIHEGYLKWSTC